MAFQLTGVCRTITCDHGDGHCGQRGSDNQAQQPPSEHGWPPDWDLTQPQTNRCHFEDNTEVIYSSSGRDYSSRKKKHFFVAIIIIVLITSSFGYIILHVFVVFLVNYWNSRLTVLKSRSMADKKKALRERSVWQQGTAARLWIRISYMSWSNFVVLLFPVSCVCFSALCAPRLSSISYQPCVYLSLSSHIFVSSSVLFPWVSCSVLPSYVSLSHLLFPICLFVFGCTLFRFCVCSLHFVFHRFLYFTFFFFFYQNSLVVQLPACLCVYRLDPLFTGQYNPTSKDLQYPLKGKTVLLPLYHYKIKYSELGTWKEKWGGRKQNCPFIHWQL